jgi:hypothetical protein
MSDFPVNIVDLIKTHLGGMTEVKNTKDAELTPTDPNGTVSIQVSSWRPVDHEIGVPEPMGKYEVMISTLTKNGNRDDGRRESAKLAKKIRVLLFRDPNFSVQLAQLNESSDGYAERVTRSRVVEQGFLDGDLSGQFAFVTLTQLDVSTEIL